MTGNIVYQDFADFYESQFKKRSKNVKTLLDVGCGTGTLTLILAKLGYDIVAVDSSEDMLCIAQEKCFDMNDITRPLFLNQSMTQLDLFGTVNAAVSSLDVINYLPPEDIPEFFRRLHLFIEPNGVFVFDIINSEHLRSLDGSISLDEDKNMFCLWRGEHDVEKDALIYSMDIFTRRGSHWERDFEEHIEYAHNTNELISQLEQAGFVNIEVFTEGPQYEQGRIFITADNTSHEVYNGRNYSRSHK